MNQLSIPFDEIIDIFEWMRRNRRSGLKKTGIFSDKELDFLVRITYDLTDKDFEYFIALILESDGFETSINGGWNDRGVDIIAKKDDTTFAIQCKQWSKARITLKDAGMYYASIYENMKKSHGRIFAYVTTSYIPEDVKEYFQMHGIYGIISNLKIIKESRKLGFFSEEGWKNMISKMRHNFALELVTQNSNRNFVSNDYKNSNITFHLQSVGKNQIFHYTIQGISNFISIFFNIGKYKCIN